MTQPMLSIIIPVYNAEKYLEECFNSILKQDFQEYEVVVINDGSTDGSKGICEGFVKKDNRFRLFTTENRGVSHARNYGIRQAAGEWLMFLDSDDYLLEESLTYLMEAVEEDTEELCACYCTGELREFQQRKAVAEAGDVITMILDPVNNRLLPEFYHLESATLLGVWGKLFRREIILRNELYFDENLKLSEDMLFHVKYLERIRQVQLSDCPVFYYRQHEESVTRSFRAENVDNRLYLFEQLEKLHKKDSVFVISTMLQLAGHVEKYTSGSQKKELEGKIRCFWESNKAILSDGKKKNLSEGKWQNQVYKICVRLLLADFYRLTEAFLHIYVKIS